MMNNKNNWPPSTNTQLDYSNYSTQKRSAVFSKLCIIGAVASLIQGGHALYVDIPFVPIIDALFAVIFILGYYLNTRYELPAKILVFASSNIILFVLASIVPKEAGIYILFFPIVIFSFVSFDYTKRVYSIGFTALSLFLNSILLLTNFQPFGETQFNTIDILPALEINPAFGINLFVSILLVGVGIDFLHRINYTSEKLLSQHKEETEKLSKELYDKNLSLEKTNKELDQFVYSTSHDLKAPLSSILGLLNLIKLEKAFIPPTVSQYLSMMKERVDRLNDFIKDILDYSRNSRLEVILSPVDLTELINEVFLTNQFLKNTSKVKLKANVGFKHRVDIDKGRISRVLNNLVANAIQYSDLTKSSPLVIVHAIKERDELILSVEDNGIGIGRDYKEKVFEMFYRGTEAAQGSGLGLYIAREMVNKMNGSLKFVSQPNKGTTFTARVPVV